MISGTKTNWRELFVTLNPPVFQNSMACKSLSENSLQSILTLLYFPEIVWTAAICIRSLSMPKAVLIVQAHRQTIDRSAQESSLALLIFLA